MAESTAAHVDEAIAEVKRLASTTVPKQAEVRQLYTGGDIIRIGVLAADAVKAAHTQVAEANIALVLVVEQLAKSLREDVEQQNADGATQSEILREKIIAITEAAKVAKDNMVAAQAQMMQLVQQQTRGRDEGVSRAVAQSADSVPDAAAERHKKSPGGGF